jgi:DNA-binding response OmpR family regulator
VGKRQLKMQNSNRAHNANILLVEDDPATSMTMTDLLESSGYHLRRAGTGAEAKAMLQEETPDLILLDLMLPDADGLVLCADIKSRVDVPIIICSASNETRDRVLGLKLGADDFVSKPFDIGELEARIEAVLRRAQATRTAEPVQQNRPAEQQRIGDLSIDHTRRRVSLSGKPLQLTPTEYRLLRTLASRADDVVTREELAQQVWGYQDASSGRTIDVHIRRLRAKLATAPNPPAIISVRGFGYKMISDTRRTAVAA